MAVVAVIIFAVPRGEPVERKPLDVASVAEGVESSMQRPVLIPELGTFWRANKAEMQGGATVVWEVTLAPKSDTERGFVKVAQAFDADASWAPQRLSGIAPTDTVRIGGLDWDVYKPGSAESNANVTYAIGTQAGDDYILLYGARSADSTAELAESLIGKIARTWRSVASSAMPAAASWPATCTVPASACWSSTPAVMWPPRTWPCTWRR